MAVVDEVSHSTSSSMPGSSGLWCGLPSLKLLAGRKARRRSQQTAHVHCLPDSYAAVQRWQGDSNVPLDGTEEANVHTQQATQDEGLMSSPALEVCAQKRLRDVPSDAVRLVYREEDPLSALLYHPHCSPLAKANDAQKLAWLRSQLVGDLQDFPTPFGIRQLVYADHAASGRSVNFIERFITHHVLPFYGNTHTDDSYVGSRTSRMMRQAEEYIKKRLGGSEDDDALLMCGWGCTAAIKRLQEVMGIAVPSVLREQVLEMMQGSSSERWIVFTGPYEHHSNLLSWRQSLAEVREIPANVEGEIDMAILEEELRAAEVAGKRRMLGAFSACSNVTGLLTNTRAIARLLHRYGALACFDFAASAPHMQLELRSNDLDGYDALVMSPHKLLGGPSAPGLLLMNRSLYKLGSNPPSTCGGGTTAYVNGFNEKDTLYHEKIEEREEGGTPPILGKVRCALAFWLKEAMGVDLIKQREDLYVKKAIKKFAMHPNIKILGNNPPTRAPIFSFLIMTTEPGVKTINGFGKPLHGRFVVKLLNDLFGIQARGGCACAGPYGHVLLSIGKELSLALRSAIQEGYEGLKPGWARLSLCYSMTEEEVDYVLSAVMFLASYGRRFLALYDFDWRSGNWTHSRERVRGLNLSYYTHRHSLVGECRKGSSSRGEQFRHYLQQAEALASLLPSCPPPPPRTPTPLNLDPTLLLFQV